jgi:Fuc2NAc and GlcNAc transferase
MIKNYAIKKSFLAHVNQRSAHTAPTPHGGGIAIAITWFSGLFYLFLTDQIDLILFQSLLIGLLISIVSFLDDMFELSAKTRLFAQSIVAFLGLWSLGGFHTLNLFILDSHNFFLTNAFAFLLIIWFINLYNFLDGINGYAGSEAVFLSIAGFILFSGHHFIILLVSVAGFLFWNYNKAKIFMGDVGSTLLGYNIAIFTLYYANMNSTDLWIWIILFSLFWFDATLTLIRRKLNKEKLSEAHNKHAYQRLTQAGWSHLKVTNYSIGLNIIVFIFARYIPNSMIGFMLTISVLYLCVKYIDTQKNFT